MIRITLTNDWSFKGYLSGSNTAQSAVTYDSSKVGTSVTPAENTCGYMRSVYQRDVTINYNANGGTGTVASQSTKQYLNTGYQGTNYVSTPSFTLATNAYTYTGYEFSKWAAGSTSGTQYAAGATYTGFAPTYDSATTSQTMYAIWNPKPYTLTITKGANSTITVNRTSSPIGGGSTGNLSSGATIYYNDVLKITFGANTGYTVGTHTVNGSAFTSGNNHTVTGNVAVVSSATGNTYTATFYYNSNTTAGSLTVATKTASCTVTNDAGTCAVTVPTEVSGSTGKYNSAYSGVSRSTGNLTAGSLTLSANTTFYAYYKGNVTVYRPSSTSACSSVTMYRNEWFTSTSAMSSSLAASATTTNASTVSGINGTFEGLATAVNTTGSLKTIATAAAESTTTYYAVSTYTTSVTGTFNYYSGSAWTTTTASGTQTRYNYCSSTSAATTSVKSNGNITVPSAVSGSTGPYSTTYVGVSTANSNMTSATPTTGTTTYYAFYRSNVTNYYYGTSYGSRTIYRNAMNNATVLSTSNTGTSNYSTAVGPGSSVWSGLSTAQDTTAEYSTVAAAATSTSTTLYTVYTMNATFAKGAHVSAIGATSGSCKITTSSTSCNVTAPTITAATGYKDGKWSTSQTYSSSGVAAGGNINVTTNGTTYYASATGNTYTAIIYDQGKHCKK